jgi:hypothetical protein
MEELMDIHIDGKTLVENFSKNEIKIIKQLQDAATNGGKPPQMTQQGRDTLMQKIFDVNNKPKESKDMKEMTPEEREQHKKELKERLRNKINYKKNLRKPISFQKNMTNNKTTINNDSTGNTNNNEPINMTNVNSLKNAIGQITGANANPEVKRRLEELFGTENLDDMLKEDKMQEILQNEGISELLGKLTGQSASSKKKKNKKKKKNPKSVEITEDNNIEKEELLDDFVEEDEKGTN